MSVKQGNHRRYVLTYPNKPVNIKVARIMLRFTDSILCYLCQLFDLLIWKPRILKCYVFM